MSEQTYRRFIELYRNRIANAKASAAVNEPVLGYGDDQIGVLGLPLPKPDVDVADIILDLLASAESGPDDSVWEQQRARSQGADANGAHGVTVITEESGDKRANNVDAPEAR